MKSKLVVLFLFLAACFPILAQHNGDKIKVAYRDISEKNFSDPLPPVTVEQANIIDYVCMPAPANPPAGKVRIYCDSGTGNLTCINSTGANVCPGNGGGAAVGPAGTGQISTGSGSLAAGGTLDDGTNFTVSREFIPLGADPYTDVRPYHVRAIPTSVAPAVPGITATIANGSNSVVLSNASTFQNGDGVTIFGAGNACALATPAAPTVTPSLDVAGSGSGFVVNAPAGSTPNDYVIIARDKAGCLTAASATGSTSTAAASLGVQNVTAAGFTRSGSTVTATTSVPHGLAAGARVNIQATTNSDNLYFGGVYTVATVADTSHFTYVTGNDVADGAPATSDGGGTVYWTNLNHLSWPVVAGAWEYYIYGRVAGSLTYIGTSRVQSTVSGLTPDTTFDDFGSAATSGAVAPYFVPTTPPSSPLADPLVTTIVSGAGTTTLTLANAASTSVTGATILFDNAPNIATAATHTTFGSLLYFPASANGYVVNSYLTIPGFVSMSLAGASLLTNDTMQIQGGDKLYGMLGAQTGSALSFGYPVGASIGGGRANPQVYGGNAGTIYLYGLQFNAGANGGVALLLDQAANSSFNYLNFTSSGTDVMTIPLIIRATDFLVSMDHIAMAMAQNPSGFGTLPTPAFMYNGGDMVMSNLSFSGRGMLKYARAVGPGINIVINGASRLQGGSQPFFTDYQAACCEGGLITINNFELDTMQFALYAQLGVGSLHTLSMKGDTFPALSFGLVTGKPLAGISSDAVTGQNNAAIAGYNFTNNPVNVTGTGELMVPIINTDLPSLAVSAGGSVPVGTTCYTMTMIDVNLNEGTVGPYACTTTTTGNQTVTVTPGAAPAGAVGWRLYRAPSTNGGALVNFGACGISFLTFAQTFVDTFAFTCGESTPIINRAGSQSVSAAGLSGTVINLLGGGFKDAISGTFTAARTQTLQDVTDTFVYRATTDTLTNKTLTSPVLNGTVTGTALQGTDAKLMTSGTIAGTGSALCTDALGGATTTGCPTSASFYQTVLDNGTTRAQEPAIEFLNGTNMTITCADSAGVKTQCTFTSSATAATAFSAITAATNSNAGSFVMSGNTLDLQSATFLLDGATMTDIAAPASPAAAHLAIFGDSTDLRFHDKNAAGVIGTTVVADAGASHNFLTAISAAGAISKAQPAFTDISGVATTAQEPTSTVNAVTNDTNVTGSIAGQTLTLGWTGTLSKARSLATVVYNDQSNAYTTGTQDFRNATSVAVPASAGLAPTTSAFIGYDTTANKWVFGQNTVTVSFGLSSSACAAHNWVSTPATSTAAASCTQPAYTDISGTLSASQITNAFDRSTNNALGAHYFDMTTITAPVNPAASTGRVYIDSSTNQLSCLLSTGVSCMPSGGGGGGANAALSNLASVAVNTSLLPGTDNAIDLGDPAFRWRNIYFAGSLIGSGTGPVTLQGSTGTCTGLGAAGTLCFSSTGNRPVYDFNLTGFNNLVLSGVDINTSDQVSATHLSSPLPAAQGGTAVTDFSFSGSTHKDCSVSGTLTSGNVVKFDASGNCVDGGVVSANVNSNTAAFTAGNVVSAAGTHSTQDSGIAVANIFTTASLPATLQAGNFCSDAGSTDAYACNLTPAIVAYTAGVHYRFKANTANTGAATIALNGLAAIPIKKATGGITTDISTNDIGVGQWVDLVYDGTNMQMQSLLGNAPGSGTVTTTGTPVSGNLATFSGGSSITNGNLSGDCTTAGALVVTCTKLNGTAFAGTNGDLVSFGAANIPADSGILATNIVRKDAANTGATGMTLDMSASTSAAAFRLPNIAGASSTTAGVLSYDTTNKGLHAGANTVDNTLGIFPSTLVPVDGDCVIWKVVTSVITLDDRGACPLSGNVNGPGTSTANDVAAFNNTAGTLLLDTGILYTNLTTNSTNYANGNLIEGTGNHTANDSGIATANVATAASNATAAKQIAVAGGANKTLSFIDFPQAVYAPAADCVNAVAGSGWSTGATPAALCRAGTNNKDALLSPWGASDVGYFKIHLPNDWDSAASLDLSIDLTSTDATNGHTIIMQASTVCAKGDGSTTDDVAFNTAQSFGTITLNGNANRTWNATLTGATKTGCIAGSTLWIKISRTTDTATNVGVYGATVDVARLLTVQAN